MDKRNTAAVAAKSALNRPSVAIKTVPSKLCDPILRYFRNHLKHKWLSQRGVLYAKIT